MLDKYEKPKEVFYVPKFMETENGKLKGKRFCKVFKLSEILKGSISRGGSFLFIVLKYQFREILCHLKPNQAQDHFL
jgi:hypothetical protein